MSLSLSGCGDGCDGCDFGGGEVRFGRVGVRRVASVWEVKGFGEDRQQPHTARKKLKCHRRLVVGVSLPFLLLFGATTTPAVWSTRPRSLATRTLDFHSCSLVLTEPAAAAADRVGVEP